MNRCHSRSASLDMFFLVVVFIPVLAIGVGIGLLMVAVGAVGSAVYSLTRHGRGPTPLKVFQAVCEDARPFFEAPAKLWEWGNR